MSLFDTIASFVRAENADHCSTLPSAAIWHCGKEPTKEGEGNEKKKREEGKEEMKVPADEIDLFSPLGSRGMEAFWNMKPSLRAGRQAACTTAWVLVKK